MNIFIYLKNLN